MDELMNLAEARALFWPHGPLSEKSLRSAIREGRLPCAWIAGKIFVNRSAIAVMSLCSLAQVPGIAREHRPQEPPPDPLVLLKTALQARLKGPR